MIEILTFWWNFTLYRHLCNWVLIHPEEYRSLFDNHYDSLVYLARTYLTKAEDSEEVVQDVFVKVWQKREHLSIQGIKTYLFKSTKNACLNFLRKKNLDTQSIDQLVNYLGTENQTNQLESLEFSHQVKNAIEQLPPKTKRVFLMNRYFEFTYREIADILDISPKTVENQMGNALKSLRKKIFNPR